MNNREKIIEVAAKHINDFGVEQLSLSKIGTLCRLKSETVARLFDSPEKLVACCILRAGKQLSEYVTTASANAHEGSALELWCTLVKFSCHHNSHATLINRYLKSPSIFPHMNMRQLLLSSIPQVSNNGFKRFFSYADPIRLVGFAYLFQMAYDFCMKRDFNVENTDVVLIKNYFYNHIQSDLNRLMDLPIN